jgi:hypothetical protein
MMRAYTIVGGAGMDNMPVLNPITTLQPITTVAGVIYSELCAESTTAACKLALQWDLTLWQVAKMANMKCGESELSTVDCCWLLQLWPAAYSVPCCAEHT